MTLYILVFVAESATLLDNGEVSLLLSKFANMSKAPRGKEIEKETSSYPEYVNVDVAFGDCMSIKGYLHALIFID